MTTSDLASTLTDLAKTLAAATPEAADRIASTLRLSCRRDCGGAPALRLKPLTIAGVQRAVAAALREAGPRGQSLPRRSYDALRDRAVKRFRERVLADIRSGAAAMPGTPAVWRRPMAGEIAADALVPGPLTAVGAELRAAEHVAVHEVLPRLVPAYCATALDELARRVAGGDSEYEHQLREQMRTGLWSHGRGRARIIVTLDGAGRLVRVLGIDAEPYRALAAAVAEGNGDPFGLMSCIFPPTP